MYVVQVRLTGKKKWATVTVNPVSWEACNAWLGHNAWAFPAHRYQRRIKLAESA